MTLPILLAASFIVGQPAAPSWHKDFESAQAEARKLNRPILAILH